MVSQPRPSGPVVRFGILGPLRIEVGDHAVRLDSPKQRALLATLLIEAGTVVPTDQLAEILWGEDQPHDPAGAIQTHVSRLRKVLATPGDPTAGDLLVTGPQGYALRVGPEQLDAGRFARLVDDARTARSARASIELLDEALALWRGPPLFEFDHLAATTEAARLDELRVSARELRADALLRLGRHGEVVAELEALVARNPLREQLCGQLMAALYRCGRQADALAAYRDLRRHLVTELGVEPSAPLRQLEQAILQQARALPWPAPPVLSTAATATTGGPLGQTSTAPALPEELTSFVGRAADVGEVAAAVGRHRVVVLTGVGGVGKSRLARHVARLLADDHADGVVLCDLLEANEPAAVAEVVASALQVLPSPEGRTVDRLVEHLRAQRVLVVLDNCEHVLAGASELVDRIGRQCPGSSVLATSRQPLRVAGQQVWPVAPLDTSGDGAGSAVQLFCDRAASVDPTFAPSDPDLDVVVDICRRVDGLPLAIELAAARVRVMSLADIAERLEHRFEVLTAEPGGTPSRHQSLHAVLDWSYELLSEATRRTFDRLAVFPGGFDLDAAGQVCSDERVPAPMVASHVAELVDHSLLIVERGSHHARYRLLESLRACAEAHLEQRGELAIWRRRHAEHVTDLVERAADGLVGPDEATWVQILDRELANVRAAHSWACAAGAVDLALRLSGSLRLYAYHRLQDEVYGWALRALTLPGAEDEPAHRAALLTAAVGHLQRGELGRARQVAEQALDPGSGPVAGNDVDLPGRQVLAELALYAGRLEEADERGADLAATARAEGRAYDEALGLLYRVHAAAYGGRTADASAHLEQGWRAVSEAGNPTLRAAYSYLEGETRLDADPEVALAALRRAVEIAGPVRNRFLAGVARVAIASLEARHGAPTRALASFRQMIDHWRASGDRVHLWTTVRNLVVLLQRIGADEAAAVVLGAARSPTTGAEAFGSDAERLDAVAAALRGSLGEATFTVACTRGRTMSDEELVSFTLAELDRLLSPASTGSPA